MSRIVLYLVLVVLANAAPPLVPMEPIEFDLTPFIPVPSEEADGEELFGGDQCVDGVNNVIKVADAKAGLSIQLSNVEARTYDKDGRPSCHKSRARLAIPGQIKAVGGRLIVKQPFDLKKQAHVKLTVRKSSFLVGTVCQDGKAKSKLIKGDVCTQPIKSPKGEFPEKIVTMLKTPGTYELSELAKIAGVPMTFAIPSIPGAAKVAAKGDWKVSAVVVSENREIAAVKVPSNTEWVYIN
ncbi:hypothetical protein OESDEN_06485 [Oesophagostomum dentatum]|uniref:Uncharacterized protein n=1 Tax=Oesophagostomum dentatum TaxID=61180 RepID=A0A0B1TCQ6_OESDE|nr:hypothetical protein OESDEN_06485 [Oesophagostomum dentatum]